MDKGHRKAAAEEKAVEAAASELIYSSTLPMLMRTACELGIPELLHAQPAGLSALQLAQRLQHNNGMEFVGGDMFQKVPKGDAIFMKWILHDWSDEDCIKILKNCHNALPKHGKLIIMDVVLEISNKAEHMCSKLRTIIDVSMLAGTQGGKERTRMEWGLLMTMENFSLQRVIDLPCPKSFIEAIPM
ncbi:hypothetical protein L7F22_029630 [Adiantum nelumboides]|nr:hypothetical protein [Adiantum nelumboides]